MFSKPAIGCKKAHDQSKQAAEPVAFRWGKGLRRVPWLRI